MAKKDNIWGSLKGLKGEIDKSYRPFDYILNTHSPSFNWLFACSHGLPLGGTLALIGKPKSGKTLMSNDFIAKLHENDPEALVVKFDTEFRSTFQNNTSLDTGIDQERLKTLEVNTSSEVFDVIEKDLAAFHQESEGKLKLIIIDSLNGIWGRRTENADTIDQQQIGDWALTVGDGMKRILPVLRRNRIALIVTAHVRAEMDRLEIMRGNAIKAAIPWASKHYLDYWCFIDRNDNKDGKFLDESQTDMKAKALQTGHKIFAKMTENGNGASGRIAEFTLNYKNGIVNIGAEVAELAKNIGLVQMPNNRTYVFEGEEWKSKAAFEGALEENLDLRNKVITAIKKTDLNIVKL